MAGGYANAAGLVGKSFDPHGRGAARGAEIKWIIANERPGAFDLERDSPVADRADGTEFVDAREEQACRVRSVGNES